MQPGVDHLIHPAEDIAFDQAHIEIPANGTFHLALFHNFGNEIQIHFVHFTDLLFGQPIDAMGFGLIQNGHMAVFLEFFKMAPDKVAKLLDRFVSVADFFTKSGENLAGFEIKEMDQDVVFILKVKIYGPIGHSRRFSDLGDGRLVETGLGKDSNGSFQNTMIFIIFDFGIGIDNAPLVGTANPSMNEYSFIYQGFHMSVKLKSIKTIGNDFKFKK
jgi:hypothetical protein